jgi:uncharacterized membrane protein YeiH
MTINGVSIDSIAAVLDWLGIVVFATTGALAASRRQMDIVGFALLATVTGIGGGTLRDVLLGTLPVFWVADPTYLVVCVGVAGVLFFIAHIPESRLRLLLWLDGVGLALFAVIGAEKALAAGGGPVVAVAMGTITATFGGIIRDVLCGETPVILSREIYVLAALLAAVVFVGVAALGLGRDAALISGFGAGLVLRSIALYWGLSLPRYRPRPPK